MEMKKGVNLLALVVLLSVNILTPISYAGDLHESEDVNLENVIENGEEGDEESQDFLGISGGQEELESLQVVENDEEVEGKLFTVSDRGLEVALQASPIESQDGCYRYTVLNEEDKEIQMVGYSGECAADLDLTKKVDGYEIVSVGYKAVGNRTLDSIKMGKNISFVGYLGLGYATEVEFPDGFDYNGLEVGEGTPSYGDHYPGFVILGGENNCLLFDVGEKKIFEYDYQNVNCNGSEIVIPEKIDGFNVEGIHGFVPGGCGGWTPINSQITNTIIIPSTLTSIGESAACIQGESVCSLEGTEGQIELGIKAQSLDFEHLGNQTLVGVKPYPGSGLSLSITDEMLDVACMYRLESHTVEFYDKDGKFLTGIIVEGVIDESDFPEIEDAEGYGHSWIDESGNPYNGGIVSEDLKLYLRVSKVGISHDKVNGIIKISDGENEYWLRDRNVGADISTGISKKELLMDLASEYENASCGLYSFRAAAETNSTTQFLENASKIIGISGATCEDVLNFIDSFDEAEYRRSFGNYYFRGNTGYATYGEMNFNEEGYSTGILHSAVSRGFLEGQKMYEGSTGWEEGEVNNPCDVNQGEYLPTPEDWRNLMRIWAGLNGETIDNAENGGGRYQMKALRANLSEPTYGTIGFRNHESYNKFADDMLLPLAGFIGFSPDVCVNNFVIQSCGQDEWYYNSHPAYLWSARNAGGAIGEYDVDNGEFMWSDMYSDLYRNFDSDYMGNVAFPVRCFVVANLVTVNFDTDEGSEVVAYKVKSGTTIIEPTNPTKTGYTFEGWYKNSDFTQEWNFDEDIVNGDMMLYAKWRVCGEGFTVKNNKCVPNNMDGIIEVSYGEDTIYIRDKNVGVDADASEIQELQNEFCHWEEPLCDCALDLGVSCCDAEPYLSCSDEYYEGMKKFYGNYYFWGNNSGTNYKDLEIDNDGNINMSKLDEKFLEGGKMNDSEGDGWIAGNQPNNPCDGEGEYLPTPEDWVNLITIWMKSKGYIGDAPNPLEIVPVEDNEYIHSIFELDTSATSQIHSIFPSPDIADEFHRDMLIPYAGGIDYDTSIYYMNFGPMLRTAQSGENVGIFNGYDVRVDTVENNVEEGGNGVAIPVRCFVKAPDVLVVTLMSDGKIANEVNVVSGNNLSKPEDPTKNGYKFLGWYTAESGGEERDFDNNVVNEDLKLYAHWQKNQSLGGHSGGGGGSASGNSNGKDSDNTSSDANNQSSENDKSSVNEDGSNNGKTSDTENEEKKQNNGNSSNVSELILDMDAYNNKYSEEFNIAYQFAYKNNITTRRVIENADMTGKLTRIAMAKMLSQYAINVMGKTPDETRNNTFNDVSRKKNAEYDNGVTLAYQLGIMGINMPGNNFRPDDIVTRGEFVSALSRMLYKTSDGKYRATAEYYTNHIKKLKDMGILTKAEPKMVERRGYVMLMLWRSVNILL